MASTEARTADAGVTSSWRSLGLIGYAVTRENARDGSIVAGMAGFGSLVLGGGTGFLLRPVVLTGAIAGPGAVRVTRARTRFPLSRPSRARRSDTPEEGSMNLGVIAIPENGVSVRFRRLPDTLRVFLILATREPRGAGRELHGASTIALG